MIADVNVVSIDPTKLLHFLPECGQRSGDWACFSIPDYDAYTPHPRLRPCHNRAACDSRAAEQSDELAAPHSITSSARASSVGGMVRRSASAVSRLTMKSNLVGCSTGMSAGLVPRRILST